MIGTIKICADDNAIVYPHQRKLARKSNGELWTTYFRSDGTTYQIYVAYSINEGVDWTEEQITNQTGANHQYCPSLALDSNDDIHLIWTGWGWGSSTINDNLQYRKRTAAGWQVQEAVTDLTGDQKRPAIAVDSAGNVHVIWTGGGWGSNPGYPNVRYRKRTTSWQAHEAITDKNYPQYDAGIAIDSSNNVHTVWYGAGWGSYPAYSNIQYRKRTTSWQTQEAVTNKNNWQDRVSLAIDSADNIHVVWNGKGWGSYPDEHNVQYRKRTTSWQTQEALTNRNYAQYGPSIAIDASNYVHVVWFGQGWDDETSYYNIQYRKRTTSWQTQIGITDEAVDQAWPNIIWALHPTLGTNKPNRPTTGYAFIWMDNVTLKYYASADLAWQTVFLLTGTIASSSAVAGILHGTWAIAGTIAAQGTISGLLIRCKFLVGTIDATLGTSGTLWRFVLFASTVGCESTTSGVLSKERRVVGTVSCESTTAGKLKTTSKIAGTIAAESITTGHITYEVLRLQGTSAAQSVTSGSMGVAWKLSGTVTGVSSTTGLLKNTRGIVGTTIATTCSVGGAIKVTYELLGTVAAVSVVSGNVTGASFYLVATAAASSTASGLLKRIRSVSRTTSMTSSLVGHLLTVVEEELAGSISSVSTTSAVMKRTRGLTGTIAASCTVSGFFVTEMAGTIAISSTTSGKTKVVYKFTTTVTCESNVTGSLTKNVTMVGSVTSQSAITGLVKVTAEFIGTSSASSTVAGVAKVTRKLVGVTIAASCTVSGDMLSVVFLVSVVSFQSTVGGVIKTSLRLLTTVACVSTVSGSTKATKKLVSVPIASVLTMAGELAWPVSIPQFNIVSAINVLPILIQDCRVNEGLKRVSVTHEFDT